MATYYAETNPTFEPVMRNILTISNADPAVVTTTFDGVNPGAHGYQTGLIVRIVVPNGFGMILLNGYCGPITVLGTSTFSVPVNTESMDPFVVPGWPLLFETPPQCIPIGQVSNMLEMSFKNVLT